MSRAAAVTDRSVTWVAASRFVLNSLRIAGNP